MAANTDIRLRDDVIYSVYLRSHTQEGTFRALIPDLDRIKALGTDVIWLMPIHPIGAAARKGTMGSPYANRDYRTVNTDYGTMEDFRLLVDEIHARGMKCIIDVVYNHTSPDSTLVSEHPEFFYRKPNGSLGNRVGEWSDVVDLDYGCAALWDYQIESLCMWASIVDGFRCDVASFVPVEFWMRAREAVEQVRPGCLWLAETVHSGFGLLSRKNGIYSANDYEMFSAFDMEYDYDTREVFDRYLRGEVTLSHYIDMLNFQECVYPANYIKLRCLENHDQPRIASFVKEERALRNYTAMLYFLKGSTLLYAGQEYRNEHLPSLFEKDPITRDEGRSIAPFLQTLCRIKKEVLSCGDFFRGRADDSCEIAILERDDGQTRKIGVFSLKGLSAEVCAAIPDGDYVDQIGGGTVTVSGGTLRCAGEPILLVCPSE